jgi:hypothetical protein
VNLLHKNNIYITFYRFPPPKSTPQKVLKIKKHPKAGALKIIWRDNEKNRKCGIMETGSDSRESAAVYL